MRIPVLNARALVLRYHGKELSTLRASKTAPTVEILRPTPGEVLSPNRFPIRWRAHDADGDALRYIVDYSADGTNYWGIAGLMADTEFDADGTMLAGTDVGRIRVTVSDGLNSVAAEVAPVRLERHAPTIVIMSLVPEVHFSDETNLFLDAMVQDPEGDADANALVWSSDRNGVLGRGRTIEVSTRGLAQGRHVITATAVDRSGRTGTKSCPVVIEH